MNGETKKWMRVARDDLDSARSNFENKKYYVAAFLSQQAAEKALKALLLKKSGRMIKIHDLVILGRKVNLPQDLLNKCELLSRAYIETRYDFMDDKIPSQKFRAKNSLEYFNIAKEVLLWVGKNTSNF